MQMHKRLNCHKKWAKETSSMITVPELNSVLHKKPSKKGVIAAPSPLTTPYADGMVEYKAIFPEPPSAPRDITAWLSLNEPFQPPPTIKKAGTPPKT